MTVNEAISQVKNALRLVHADRRLTVKYIYSVLDKHTAWIIKRESDKMQLIKTDHIWQTLPCVETMEVPTTDPCCKYTSKCKILRTKNKIPSTYEDSWGIVLKHVSSIDNTHDLHPIKLSEWTRKLENANFKYDKTLYYFYRDGYLYFPNMQWKLVSITGFFKENIAKYNDCEDDSDVKCMSFLDTEWRVPPHLQHFVIDATLKELTSTFMAVNPAQETNINKNEQ